MDPFWRSIVFVVDSFCVLTKSTSTLPSLTDSCHAPSNDVFPQQITTATLDRFLLAIEDGYKRPQNPYHNEFHATDVTHSVHYFLSRVGLMVSQIARFAPCVRLIRR